MLDISIRQIGEYIIANKQWLFGGLGVVIFSKIVAGAYVRIKWLFTKSMNMVELIQTRKDIGERYKSRLSEALRIGEIMKESYSEYNDYLLIQYGSSVDNKVTQPNDYDFIVLLLGHPSDDEKEERHIGSLPNIENNKGQMTKVDVVFRDYTSFLFAACAGMPYENSIITNSKLIDGHKGYYQWLKNITGNIIIDKNFLLRRFDDKINTEKELFDVECKYGRGEYDFIRAAYYYTTSLLQYNRIMKMNEIMIQDSVINISKVDNLIDDIRNLEDRQNYENLISMLKRRDFEKTIIEEEAIITLIENITKEINHEKNI